MADKFKKLKVEYIDINQLRPWEDNPRKNDEAVEDIVKSFEAFGYTNPILVRKQNNEIIAGHTRVKALQSIGESQVPVILLDMDEADAHAYALYDNKSVENTEWDGLKLGEVFAQLDELNVDLDLTGFTAEEIEDFVIGPTDEPQEPEPQNNSKVCPECGYVFGGE